MNNQLYIQIPLDASCFLKSEFQIDRLLDFAIGVHRRRMVTCDKLLS